MRVLTFSDCRITELAPAHNNLQLLIEKKAKDIFRFILVCTLVLCLLPARTQAQTAKKGSTLVYYGVLGVIVAGAIFIPKAIKKMKYAPAKITEINYSMDNITFGTTRKLQIEAKYSNHGKTYSAIAENGAWTDLKFSDFDVKVEGGTYSKGEVTANKKENCPGGKLKVTLSYRKRSGFDKVMEFELVPKVTGIKVSFDEMDQMTFGSKRNLKIEGTFLQNGKVFNELAKNDDNATLKFSDFDVKTEGGVYEKGILTVNKKLTDCPGGKLKIKVTYKLIAGSDTTIFLDLLSQKGLSVGFYGASGYSGGMGAPGIPGSNTNGICQEGGRANNGYNAQHGEDGPEVWVYIKKINSKALNRDVLAIKLINIKTNDTLYSYIDPKEGAITIYARGGYGGNGGGGGYGGSGGCCSNSGKNCKGGAGGDGGDAGDGGNGGYLKVYVDKGIDIKNLKIKFDCSGGQGGYAGAGGMGGLDTDTRGRGATGRNGRGGKNGSNSPTPEIVVKEISESNF